MIYTIDVFTSCNSTLSGKTSGTGLPAIPSSNFRLRLYELSILSFSAVYQYEKSSLL